MPSTLTRKWLLTRRLVQGTSLGLFLAALLWIGRGESAPRGASAFLLSDPLGMGLAALSAGARLWLWAALAMLLLTAVLGRAFCGWLCPLGVTLDCAGRAARVRPETLPLSERAAGRRVKYYVLGVLVVVGILGAAAVGWLDPLSMATRTWRVLLDWLAFLLVGLAGRLDRLPRAGEHLGWLSRGLTGLFGVSGKQPLAGTLGIMGFSALVVGLVAARPRWWCRHVCPLGAGLALAGRWAAVRRGVSDACIRCGRCARVCPMGCISEDGQETLAGECTLCARCQAVCPVDAIRFVRRQSRPARTRRVGLTRRGLLASVAAGVALAPVIRLGASARGAGRGEPIRPPLAGGDEDRLARLCIRCGQCMAACPNRAIHPAGLDDGLLGLWSPKIVPRIGNCLLYCTACGDVCPTGAIPSVRAAIARSGVADLRELDGLAAREAAGTLDEASSVRLTALRGMLASVKWERSIGKARIDRSRCIPWVAGSRLSGRRAGSDGEGFDEGLEEGPTVRDNCGICAQVCPLPESAIGLSRKALASGGELERPFVRTDLCVGCGACEQACPVEGRSAIVVEGIVLAGPAQFEAGRPGAGAQ